MASHAESSSLLLVETVKSESSVVSEVVIANSRPAESGETATSLPPLRSLDPISDPTALAHSLGTPRFRPQP